MRKKLNAMPLEFAGKSIMLVDGEFYSELVLPPDLTTRFADSIVRGTTSREIIQMAREAGATRVIMASAAPPIR